MSNNQKKLGNKQMSLFEMIQGKKESEDPKKGALNISTQHKKILSKCVTSSKFSVIQIACRMTEYLDNGEPDSPVITHHMIYAWCALSKDGHRIPAEFEPAFCYAVESFEPIEFLAQQTDRYLMPSIDALRSEIQLMEEKRVNLDQEIEKRKFFIETQNSK